jgi:hypothetical protein
MEAASSETYTFYTTTRSEKPEVQSKVLFYVISAYINPVWRWDILALPQFM